MIRCRSSMRAAGLIGVASSMLLLTFAGCAKPREHPSDASMLKHFSANRDSFETLAAMALSDMEKYNLRGFRIRESMPNDPSSSIDTQRQIAYLTLMRIVEVPYIIVERWKVKGEPIVYIYYSVISWYTEGTSKGYTYSRVYGAPLGREFDQCWSIFENL